MSETVVNSTKHNTEKDLDAITALLDTKLEISGKVEQVQSIKDLIPQKKSDETSTLPENPNNSKLEDAKSDKEPTPEDKSSLKERENKQEGSTPPKSINLAKNKDHDITGLKSISDLILRGKAKNIIVLSGAGISTSSGIPDFRSPNTGLYDNLQQFDLPYAEAIFDIEFFEENPKPFYTLAKELYPGNFNPTLSHAFIKMIADNGLLLRNYTQNIDTLERIVGLDSKYIIEAHGSFYKAHCINRKCNMEYSQDWIKTQIDANLIPKCCKCKKLVKPDITFFGEQLPGNFYQSIRKDFAKCDLLIIMGTSLQVYPFASLVNKVTNKTSRLLINRERVGEVISGERGLEFDNDIGRGRDHLFLGDSDDACFELVNLLGWKDQLYSSYSAIVERYKSKV